MRFYIMTDMEGVSGVVDFDAYCNPSGSFYEKARRLATLEVNAAIQGIRDTGDHEIVVCDGHGSGAMDIEILHKAASLIMGRPLDLLFEMGDGHYDGFFMVGQHAMKGASNANLDHTFDHINIKSLSLNGTPIGEAGINALRAGIFGIPTIYLSGDVAACEEIKRAIPGILTCPVKRGITTTSAVCLQPEKAREKIRETAALAIRNIHFIRPYKLEPPYEAVFEFNSPDRLKQYANKTYCKTAHENKVHIYADSMRELLEKNLWGL